MKPYAALLRPRCVEVALFVGSVISVVCGCNALAVRSQSPEDPIEKLGSEVPLIGDYTTAFGMNYIPIETVALVTGLPNTGSDPSPSPQRAAIIADMQARGIKDPNQILASPTTELVLVRGYLRPGIQKGDHFDIEVRTLSRSECHSLRDGWLMECRMRETALLDNSLHEGTTLARGEGPILVDPSATTEDKVSKCRGRILGGGLSTTSRELGLIIKAADRNFLLSAQVGTAVNRRFHTFDAGIKVGVASPKTDEFILIKLHPRYKDNIERYMRVLRCVPLRESPAQLQARLQLLERQLMDPITASTAALRLEAIGKPGIDVLRKGLDSAEEEVRFYTAEALAYLDDPSAAPTLGELARDVPAFRAYALAALSAMDDLSAYEALRDLLKVASAETRYGAFRSLWAMNARDPLVRGEVLGQKFNYHVLNTEGPAMVHVTRSFRPEIVLFGDDQKFETPLMLEAGKDIVITTLDDEHLTVSRFVLGEPDQKRVVGTRIDDVVRAIVELGGTYPDVVQALQHAKSSGALVSRFQIDALPQSGRQYLRKEETSDEPSTPDVVVANPLPDLFTPRGNVAEKHSGSDGPSSSSKDEKPGRWKDILARISGKS